MEKININIFNYKLLMSEKKTNRRDFLFTATYAVGAVGVGATIWPMIDQMNPDASVKALASTLK